MKLPSERSPIRPPAAAVGDARPPKAAAVAPAVSELPATPSSATTGQNTAPLTALTDAVARSAVPVVAEGPPMAARGDDDLMSQRL
jgi:hypothetical protein